MSVIKRPIAITLARYGLIMAIILGLIMALFQIRTDFQREKQRNFKLVQNILALSSAGVTQAAFQLDEKLAVEALKPLLTHGFVASATLVDDRGRLLGSVDQPPEGSHFDELADLIVPETLTFGRTLVEQTSGIHVGRLTIQVDSSALYRDFYLRSVLLIAYGILRSLLLTLVLLFLFHRLLTRPLAALAARLRLVDPRAPRPVNLPRQIIRGENEITFLASSTNEILDRSRLHLADLAEAERQTAAMTDQLRHNERLSAIGQLVGGVAHDFNNILAIIMGTVELIGDDPGSPRARDLLAIARQATEKGAKLTAHLLAYSRRQPLSPEPLLGDDLIRNLEPLLRRALGERYKIEFVSTGGLWHCLADRQQLETALLNLTLNARDAMPKGGSLTIDTRNAYLDTEYCAREEDLTPGQYVCFAVSDNGVGMSDEVLSRAIEPYFTTKPPCSGSGLGLAMAYGFTKQSGGHLKICSEQGKGTTVRLHLPRYRTNVPPVSPPPAAEHAYVDLQSRPILVVDDDPMVLEVVKAHLNYMNARVTTATSAQETVDMLAAGAAFDAALIDVTLPDGTSGRDLSRLMEKNAPGLPIAFMSGYTEDAIIHNARLDDDVILLQKPFTRQALANVIERLLNGHD